MALGDQSYTKEIIIAITNSKYKEKTDRFAEQELGIQIIRHSERNLSVQGQIIDDQKFSKYFATNSNIKLSLLPCKPKDMTWLLASKRVTHLITFDTLVKNFPKIYSIRHEIVDPSICLALIQRQNDIIEPENWTQQNKTLIATEYICQVTKFFQENNIDDRTFHLDKITGSSEAFLVNSNRYL